MFKGRIILQDSLCRPLKPSVGRNLRLERCKSTKSAIHSALHQPWRSRGREGGAHESGRSGNYPNRTGHAVDWEPKGSREAEFSQHYRHHLGPRQRGRRASGDRELERDNTDRGGISQRRRFDNSGTRESDSEGSLLDEDSSGDTRWDESFNRMQGSWQDSHDPLSISYTTSASEFLYGQSVVTAALRAGRREFYKLYMYPQRRRNVYGNRDSNVESLARKANVPIEKVGMERVRLLDKMSEGRPHNGFVLEASPLPKLPITGFDRLHTPGSEFLAFLGRQSQEDEKINGTDPRIKYNGAFPRFPFVLLLDGVLDPQNLGAILRSAFFFGVDAIALTTNRTAPLSAAALKASAGASEALPILIVDQTRDFLMGCKRNGWKVYASTADRVRGVRHLTVSNLISDVDRKPCILIIGSEGQGLYKDVQGTADNTISIEGPRQGELDIDSLNVSVATGLLCQSFLRDPSEGEGRRDFQDVHGEEFSAPGIQERLF